jgi:hypothetical protein
MYPFSEKTPILAKKEKTNSDVKNNAKKKNHK